MKIMHQRFYARLCVARGRQDGRAQSGGSARLDEVAPAGGRLIPKLGDRRFAFFDHDKFPPRTSFCWLDDPVTFAINEDHAPKIRSCKDRPLCEAREDEIAHSMRRPLANTLVCSFRARLIAT